MTKKQVNDSPTVRALASLATRQSPPGEDSFKFGSRAGRAVIGEDAADVLEDAPTDHGQPSSPKAEGLRTGSQAQLIEIVRIVHGQSTSVDLIPAKPTQVAVVQQEASRQQVQVNTNARVYTRDQINAVLLRSDEAVERGILTLFKLQTQDEQQSGSTVHHNGCGFNSATATVGTRFARWLMGMDDNNRVRYPPKSLGHPKAARVFKAYIKESGSVVERARQICLLHSQQLTDVANRIIVVKDE